MRACVCEIKLHLSLPSRDDAAAAAAAADAAAITASALLALALDRWEILLLQFKVRMLQRISNFNPLASIELQQLSQQMQEPRIMLRILPLLCRWPVDEILQLLHLPNVLPAILARFSYRIFESTLLKVLGLVGFGFSPVVVWHLAQYCFHHCKMLQVVVGLEKSIAGEELDEDAADRPYVAGERPTHTEDDFGRTVVSG